MGYGNQADIILKGLDTSRTVGMAAGFSRSNTYGLLQVEWQPAPEVHCSLNQPIAACTLTPQQKHYTITLNLAYLQPGVGY